MGGLAEVERNRTTAGSMQRGFVIESLSERLFTFLAVAEVESHASKRRCMEKRN